MGGRVERIGGFGEEPFVAGVVFAKGKEVGGDIAVLFAVGEAFFGDEELVHEGKADGRLLGSEVERAEFPAEFAGRFPADLATETGFIAAALNVGTVAEDSEEGG